MSYSIAVIPSSFNKQRVILARLQKGNRPGYQRGLAFWGAFDAAGSIAKDSYTWQLLSNQEPQDATWVGSLTTQIIDELIKIVGEKS